LTIYIPPFDDLTRGRQPRKLAAFALQKQIKHWAISLQEASESLSKAISIAPAPGR
jgi:hypothetical protein